MGLRLREKYFLLLIAGLALIALVAVTLIQTDSPRVIRSARIIAKDAPNSRRLDAEVHSGNSSDEQRDRREFVKKVHHNLKLVWAFRWRNSLGIAIKLMRGAPTS